MAAAAAVMAIAAAAAVAAAHHMWAVLPVVPLLQDLNRATAQ
jgi:hypothetical protein